MADTGKLADGLYARMDTDKGEIILSLEFEKTPMTVCNFVGLAEGSIGPQKGKPYYDGIAFHRVIADFMVQGGDPTGTGSGGPGYKFADEIVDGLTHSGPGILSMANAGPGTNGSQFFITHVATPWLDGKHTVFGRVVSGLDVVNAIAQGDRIRTVKIERVGEKAKAFDADSARFEELRNEREGAAKKREAARRAADEDKAKVLLPGAKRSGSGIYYAIGKEGSGKKPKAGASVSVYYTGKLLDGSVFDSSVGRGPIEIPVGRGKVIKAWDETLLEMSEGEKRTIILPPELGYGERGYPGVIPPSAWLLFEMELMSVK